MATDMPCQSTGWVGPQICNCNMYFFNFIQLGILSKKITKNFFAITLLNKAYNDLLFISEKSSQKVEIVPMIFLRMQVLDEYDLWNKSLTNCLIVNCKCPSAPPHEELMEFEPDNGH